MHRFGPRDIIQHQILFRCTMPRRFRAHRAGPENWIKQPIVSQPDRLGKVWHGLSSEVNVVLLLDVAKQLSDVVFDSEQPELFSQFLQAGMIWLYL